MNSPIHRDRLCEHLVRRVIEEGADVNQRFYQDQTPIFFAAQTDNVSLVRLLIELGADVSAVDIRGLTPLHAAALQFKNSLANQLVCKLLIESGADCNRRDDRGNTPFHYALITKSLKVIELFLDHGADIALKAQAGATALHYAASNPHLAVFQFLLDHEFNVDIDIDIANENGQTPLMAAAESARYETCELLLKHGAMVNKMDASGFTPLTWSSQEYVNASTLKTIDVLFEHGANVSCGGLGNSALERATYLAGIREIKYCFMRHVAKLEYQGVIISEDDRRIIVGNSTYKRYYRTWKTHGNDDVLQPCIRA